MAQPAARGAIYNSDRAKQLRDFTGLQYGKITPTDIDGFIDFGDKVFIFIETKLAGVDLPFGQRLALERLTDACAQAGKHTLAVIAVHQTLLDQQINVAAAQVSEVRFAGRWIVLDRVYTVRETINRFLARHAPEYVKSGTPS
jgi:hypothetical protein